MPRRLDCFTPEERKRIKHGLKEGGVFTSKHGRKNLREHRAAMRARYKDRPDGQAVWLCSVFRKADEAGHIVEGPNHPITGVSDRFCVVRMLNGEVFDNVLFYEEPPHEIPGLYAACYPRGAKS